jgi:signal-transduction protein with cAMP-binding, CBS, and nucleotidyltransferase domain
MRAIEATRKPVATIPAFETITEAARKMNDQAVGALIVLDGERPVGIVTDRDLVLRALARGLPVDSRVDSVMTTEVISLDPDADLREALAIFRSNAIRRIPLIESERVLGMITVDDLLIDLTNDMADVVRPVTGEVIFGNREGRSELAAR